MENERAVLVSKNNITPPNTKKIYLVRHGKAGGSGKIENLNPHLNDLGIRQAKSLKKIFEKGEIDRVVTSNLYRTQETAKIVTDLEPIALDKLNELHSGKGWEDIPPHAISDIVNSRLYLPHDSREHSESLYEFHRRVEDAWNKVINYEFDNLLLVSHYEVMRVILSIIFKTPATEIVDYLIPFAHTSVTEIRIVDTIRDKDLPSKMVVLQRLNDTSHLADESISF